MPRINLLPWREQQRTERKKSFAVGMIAAVVAAVAVTGGGYLFMSGLIDAQNGRNNRLTNEIKVLDKAIQEINDLEQQKQQFIARMQIIEKLQRSRPEIVHVFDAFVQTIPDGTYLTSMVQNGQRFKIQGVAQSSTRVASFLRALEASEWLSKPDLEQYQGRNFTINAVQVTTLTSDTAAPGRRSNSGAKK